MNSPLNKFCNAVRIALLPFILIVSFNQAQAQAFITTWVTDNGQIIIPTTGGGYNYDITWTNLSNAGVGDGSASGVTGNYTVFGLTNVDVYEVQITGLFPRIYFGGSTFQNQGKIRSIEQWGSNPWTSMEGSFDRCRNMVINAPDAPDLSNVTSLGSMFVGVRHEDAFTNTDLSAWDVSTINDMSYLFNFAWYFNQDISNWDVSNVTNMAYMFGGAYYYNQPLNAWDVSNVTNMELMFFELSIFDQPLDQWDVSNVEFMNGMFSYTEAFNQPLASWDVSSVTNMQEMFGGAEVFNQPLNSWNVSSVTNMSLMFENANVVAFNQPLDNWDVSNVTEMWRMFSFSDVFNQDISSWDVSNVTDMWQMFRNATAFNQDLGSWDVGNVIDMDNMLNNSGLSIANYDATLIGWAGLPSLQSGINLGALSLNYCLAETARNSIISNYSWSISDAGLNCLPIIISFTPTSAANGATVTITGDNFTGATSVSFGGTAANSFTVVNSTTITAEVGAGASGNVEVITPEGTAALSGFTFIPAPTIASFTPTSAASGATVTITGTNFTGASAVSFGGIAATTFTVVNTTTITAVVGTGASGNLVVVTPGGTATLAGFTFIPAPTIASFTPTSAASGATVTITGTNFTGASAVSFGGVAATSFTVVNATTVTAVVGTGASGNLVVVTPGGTATLAGFTFIPPPTISIDTQPQAVNIVCLGEQIFLSISASGTTNLTYQWEKFNTGTAAFENLNDNGDYSGTTTNTLTIIANALTLGGDFRCRVSGDAAADVFTNIANLDINPLPEVTLDGNRFIAPDGASSYQWYRNGDTIDGATGHYLDVFDYGVYYVSVTGLGGCDGVSEPIEFFVTNFSDTGYVGWEVFPNPTRGILNIKIPETKSQATLTMYDLRGRLVSETRVGYSSGYQQWEIKDLPQGIYYLHAKDGDAVKTWRILFLP